MTRRRKGFIAAVAGLTLASGLVLGANAPSLAQQRPTEDDILNALKPAQTRGLATERTGQSTDEQRFIDSIRTIKTRQLTLSERRKVADIAKTKPSVDLEVYFDYDSAVISSQAEPDLMALGRALSNPDLKGGVFLVAGHTDAKGTDEYNQALSERRAAAVKKFLRDKFRLPEDSLVTAGYGEEQLKNAADPSASENRRVQIVNLEQKSARR